MERLRSVLILIIACAAVFGPALSAAHAHQNVRFCEKLAQFQQKDDARDTASSSTEHATVVPCGGACAILPEAMRFGVPAVASGYIDRKPQAEASKLSFLPDRPPRGLLLSA
ncbi:hypothetical protein [Aquamicrobium sp. LC103]|uniref:hypothetical protein n=1 Tax=Aquamicrobium sp. LC103 TaxID=1120658 RepID=UPI00063EB485|nr:hypothetical protein [Aquamicrobium sp. LC103]TKT79185.1 hypothetical protein XW59_009650 [Aquamicrobium sp. LC103]